MQGREVKYRAHVHQLGWVVEVVAIDFSLREVELDMTRTGDTAYYRFDEIDLIQYTGLRDKNGKEIYEGDVGREDGVFYQVIWVDSGAMYGVKVIKTDFVLTRQLTFPLHQYIIEGTTVCNFEIIGNIYENPELLEVDK